MTRKRPKALPVVLGAWAAFCVGFALLGLQLRAGKDPALGAPPVAVAAKREQPKIVVRRVIRKVIIEEPAGAGASATSGGSSAPVSVAAASSAPAPAPAPPAPAPAAPAPAPVTTSSS